MCLRTIFWDLRTNINRYRKNKINNPGDIMSDKYKYERIRDLREDNDLRQADVAKKLNLHLTQYRRYETGETEIPVHILKELCCFYNVSSDYLIGLTNDYKSLPKK